MTEKYPNKVQDLPEGVFWAILQNKSVHVPGDERSRSAPGHGYPAHNENFMGVQVFEDDIEFAGVVEGLVKGNATFRAFMLHPVEITTKTEVKVDGRPVGQ